MGTFQDPNPLICSGLQVAGSHIREVHIVGPFRAPSSVSYNLTWS